MSELLKVKGASIPKETKATAKVNNAYGEALRKVRIVLRGIKKRQEQAAANITKYQEELAVTGIDVAVVTDDQKRKELLDRRSTLRAMVEEEELYINLDYQGYKERVIHEAGLDELNHAASLEYKLLHTEVQEYKAALDAEAKKSRDIAEDMSQRNSEYVNLVRDHQNLTGEYIQLIRGK